MTKMKNIFKVFEATKGDTGKDAALAVKNYSECVESPERVAEYARSVAKNLEELARILDDANKPYDGPRNVRSGDYYVCGADGCEGRIHEESHQADPCAQCHNIFHDRCFYVKTHPCVLAGIVTERPDYAKKK